MTVKFAISLPDETAAAVRRAVDAGDAPSVSAYIAAAIEEKCARRRHQAIVTSDPDDLRRLDPSCRLAVL